MHQTCLPRRFRAVAILFTSLGVGISQVAAAQPNPTTLEPFRVEAEFGKDGLRIQNSNAVLNPYLLDQHGVAQLQDTAGIAPNLFSSNSDSRGFGDVFALRGMTNTIFFSAPAVALIVDDVPGGSVSAYPSSLLNIDSFTVKAGPQGTDYGRNAPGGVIEIKSRAPGSAHRGRLLLDYGSYNASSLQAGFDGPLYDTIGYSVGLGLSDRDGYIRNMNLRRSADDRNAVNGRGALYWAPNSTLQVRVGAVIERARDDAVRLSSLFSPDPFEVTSNRMGQTRLDRLQFSFQVRKTLAWGSLIATSSYQDWDLDPAVTDLDLSPADAAWSQVSQSEEVWTQEIRFESPVRSNQPNWRAGLFFSDSSVDGDATRVFGVPPSTMVPPGFVQTERTVFGIGQTSVAAYANADHSLAPKTTIKVGIRAEYIESDLDRTKAGSNNFGFPTAPDPRLNRSQKRDYVSGTVGLTHALSDSLSVVARTSPAYKPAGFSGFTADPARARFRSERLWSTEAGVTFGPPKGRFGGSVLGFWTDSRNYQLERTVPFSTDFVVVNAKKVTALGVEAKFMWNPIEGVWWDFQAGYTDATFDEHYDAAGANVSGNNVPFVPEYTVRTGVTVGLGRGFSANVSVGGIGRTYYDERNTGAFSQKAYGIVNAQVRYRFEHYAVTVYGQNLFDQEYYQFINPEIFAGSPGAPARFGVQFSFEY